MKFLNISMSLFFAVGHFSLNASEVLPQDFIEEKTRLLGSFQTTEKPKIIKKHSLIVTNNKRKFEEYKSILNLYNLLVVQVEKSDIHPSKYCDDDSVRYVFSETSFLCDLHSNEKLNSEEYRHMKPVYNKCVLKVYFKNKQDKFIQEKIYEHKIKGSINFNCRKEDDIAFDWDDIFVVQNTGLTYHDTYKQFIKVSARDLVLADFFKEYLHFSKHKDFNYYPIKVGETVDISVSGYEFAKCIGLFESRILQHHNLDRFLNKVLADGFLLKSPETRREGIYWFPGLNSPVPTTPKGDEIHEITFLYHDLMHQLIKDLVPTGITSNLYKQVYIIYRMSSEAITLVLADMFYIDCLSAAHVDYDFTTRKIYPLFCALEHQGVAVYHESYAKTKKKDPKMGNGDYKRKDPHYDKVYNLNTKTLEKKPKTLRNDDLLLEAGHGADFADTITYKGSNSSRDNRNFVPQNDYYNESVRNPLVRFLLRPKKHGYKEISIYPRIPQLLDATTPLPIGFVFIHYDEKGNIIEGFYFPNLIDYKKIPEYLANRKGIYKTICDRYKLDAKLIIDLFGNSVISDELSHKKMQNQNSHIGYRALSGRFTVLPEGDTWDATTRHALIKTAAMLKMESSAELDYLNLENQCALVELFSDQEFSYLEFNDTLFEPARAAYWLKRVEERISNGISSIEDTIRLLEIYQSLKNKNFIYPLNITKEESQLYFSQRIIALEPQIVELTSHNGDIHNIYELMNYFSQCDEKQKVEEWNKHLDVLVCTANINPEDRREVASWYLTGREAIPQNLDKALSLLQSIVSLEFYEDAPEVVEGINTDISEITTLLAGKT